MMNGWFSDSILLRGVRRVFLSLGWSLLCLTLTAQSIVSDTSAEGLSGGREYYFIFPHPGNAKLSELSRKISIDRIEGDSVVAYAHHHSFSEFLDTDIAYRLLPAPGASADQIVLKSWAEIQAKNLAADQWAFYPTYDAYVSMMHQFEKDFPDLVEVHSIGETVMGRELLFARIFAGDPLHHPHSRFMYTSTMHGDETAGFALSLRLIHHLLSSYGEDEGLTNLLHQVEIWICPNENPDGTYRNDNSNFSGATRGNANYVDINRNYPNPVSDPRDAQQPETTAMIAFVDTMNFIMSANMHGGIELVNYPFDSWRTFQRKHADHDWWLRAMHAYVDTVHTYAPQGYMTGQGGGVTHGGDWYVVYGSRQDYLNYYLAGREFTLELSNVKLVLPSELPLLWEYNHRSLINYIKESTNGFRGLVYDNETGSRRDALFVLPELDEHYSKVRTWGWMGQYSRPVVAGVHEVEITVEGMEPILPGAFEVEDGRATIVMLGLSEEESIASMQFVEMETSGEGRVFPVEQGFWVNTDASLHLSASPRPGWEFSHWLVNGSESHSEPQWVVPAEGIESILAVFDQDPVSQMPVLEASPNVTVLVYPNPLSGHGIITVNLPSPEAVVVEIFRLDGRLVSRVNHGLRETGQHEFPLVVSSLGSGYYVVRIHAGSSSGRSTFVVAN